MDRFAIYLMKQNGSRMRVVARAVDAVGYAYDLELDLGGGTWVPYGERTTEPFVGVDARFRAITSLVTSALALGVPPRMCAMEGLDEMPVWVVHETSTPALVLAKLHERVQRAEAAA
jgi:hypothetical protein